MLTTIEVESKKTKSFYNGHVIVPVKRMIGAINNYVKITTYLATPEIFSYI